MCLSYLSYATGSFRPCCQTSTCCTGKSDSSNLHQGKRWWAAIAGVETCLRSTTPPGSTRSAMTRVLQRLRPCSWRRTDCSGGRTQQWEALAKCFALQWWWCWWWWCVFDRIVSGELLSRAGFQGATSAGAVDWSRLWFRCWVSCTVWYLATESWHRAVWDKFRVFSHHTSATNARISRLHSCNCRTTWRSFWSYLAFVLPLIHCHCLMFGICLAV